MKRCSSGHGEVFYEDAFCPACQIIDKLTAEISRLERNIDRLESEKVNPEED